MADFSQAPRSSSHVERVTQQTTLATGVAITSDAKFQDQSFEEIRLQDYTAGRYGRKFSSYAVADLSSVNVADTQHLLQVRSDPGETLHLGSAIVTFRVGSKTPQDFVIHEGVIAPGSEFVRLSLRGDWKEAKERIIPLPEDVPEVFAMYQKWLYSGQIRSFVDLESGGMDEYELLVHAYILGEKFLDVDFKDCIADAIVEKLVSQARFSLRLTDEVFSNTPSHSPLRRLWMDVYYWAGCADWLDEKTVGQPINLEFMTEFSRFQMRLRQSQASSSILNACNYHQHKVGKCYRNSNVW